MFDKELFISLCEKYGVEFSETAKSPMLHGPKRLHGITKDDIYRIFAPRQTFFDYSTNKISTKANKTSFYLQEDYAMAC